MLASAWHAVLLPNLEHMKAAGLELSANQMKSHCIVTTKPKDHIYGEKPSSTEPFLNFVIGCCEVC